MQQWTPAQVHDTVAAIVSQPDFVSAERQSLFGRLLRYMIEWFTDLFRLFRGSFDARIVIAVAIGLVIVIVFGRIVADRRIEAGRRRRLGTQGLRGERRDYWSIARELAAGDRFIDASHAAYAAVLETLTSTGAIKYHPSKTSGDYARELRRAGSPVASDFRRFGRELDRAVYGRGAVARAEFEQLIAAAEQIARSTRHERAA